MKTLLQELQELGYELVKWETMDAWKILDDGGESEYFTTNFTKTVIKHGYVFSCGTHTFQNGKTCMYVRFEKL